jgi:hypothetical protein
MTSLDGESNLKFLEEADVLVSELLWDASLGEQGTHISNSYECVKKVSREMVFDGRHPLWQSQNVSTCTRTHI